MVRHFTKILGLVVVVATLGAGSARADWNSGGPAPQQLELDLGEEKTLSGLSLTVVQDPAGETVHRIFAGPSPNPTTLVQTLSGWTANGDVLRPTFAPPLAGVRYVRIETTVSPSWVAWGPIDFVTTATTDAPPPPFKALADPCIQLFGYYGSAMNGVGSGDFTNDVAPHSNVVWVRWATNDELLAKVRNARQQGLGVVLMVQNLFFPWASSQLYGDEPGTPHARFDAVWQLLEPYRSSIKGFYLFDEPYWNNTNVSGSWTTVPDAQLKSNLSSVAAWLHSAAPGVPSIVIFAFTEISRPEFFTDLLPTTIDWIGFDDYLAFGAEGSESKVRSHFDDFVRFKDPSQRIVLVPDAYWSSAPDAATDMLIAQRLTLYQELATSSADVVAIFPFLYQSVPDENLWGAQSLPSTATALANYFDALLAGRAAEGRAPR